ncbi:Acyl-CoA N-acyltransferase [Moelleriella libera RCEF 2490]|uniref:Acyl-CoA N-acyltransferase n=1 Tax=Moelleriella libera RCEF 2490 TaxID=1081109 RepID=A0A168EGW1_9HYPO|nr:Acyl-CoA N-acyltransferase [Moelleriella libera RCEF 2490]
MGQVVLPSLISDIRRAYDAFFSSFEQDVMGRIMLGILFPGSSINDEEFRKAHAAGTLEYWHTTDHQYTIKCVDTRTGGIIGVGLYDVFLRERSTEERQNYGASWLEGEHRERAEKIINPLWEMRESLFGGRPYIYCHLIAVDPKHQGRKAGQQLVRWGTQLSDSTTLPIYVESSPSTVNFYKKLGFELLPETVVHKAEVLGIEDDVSVPLMVKMPSAARGLTFEEWRRTGYPDF